jgi:hypothetical protein
MEYGEKGGKEHEIPVHHLLEETPNDYIAAAGLRSGQPLLVATVRFYTRGVRAVHKTEHLSAAFGSIAPVTPYCGKKKSFHKTILVTLTF